MQHRGHVVELRWQSKYIFSRQRQLSLSVLADADFVDAWWYRKHRRDGASVGRFSGVPHLSQPASTDLSDATSPTSWTPADASGGSLTFTSSDTLYSKIGKVCTVSFAITYPTTSDTHLAAVSGIPSVCAAKNGTLNYVAGGSAFTGLGSSGLAFVGLQTNGQSLFFFQSGNPQTNANLSGAIIRGTITYIAN